jgi:hypothetical protein
LRFCPEVSALSIPGRRERISAALVFGGSEASCSKQRRYCSCVVMEFSAAVHIAP